MPAHSSPLRVGFSCFGALPAMLIGGGAAWAEAQQEGSRTGILPVASKAFADLWQFVAPIVTAMPSIPGETGSALAAIAASAQPGLWIEIAKVFVAIGLLFVAKRLMRAPVEDRLEKVMSDPLAAIVLATLADFIIVAVLLVLAAFLSEFLFRSATLAASFGAAVLDAFVRYRLAANIPLLLFRPGAPTLRLLPASEAQIAAGSPWFLAAIGVGMAFTTLVPVFIEAGMAWQASQALGVSTGAIVAILGYMAASRFLAASEGHWPRLRNMVAAAAILFWLLWSFAIIRLDFALFFALVGLGSIAVLTLILNCFLARAQALSRSEANAKAGHYLFWQHYGAALRRSANVLAVLAVVLVLAALVVEKAPMLFNTWRTLDIERSLRNSFAVLAIGYLVFEFLTSWTRAKFAPRAVSAIPGDDDHDEAMPTSRLSTVMPILQGFAGVLILGISVLIALSKLGVDTTPLLAGAGIFGLAVSFGSQSLVRDIVAGIFYMADDAFRVGEYIEAGRLKGSVEKITLRSVRLRHQNGQIHTVPFGQLGAVTNYSRDYVTLKFNLRLDRNVDIELVRKTTKKIGLDMLDDPEMGKEFIQQLKMQGIADIQESALVVRFKFTVRPGKPTYVQREAMKRIIRTFSEKGIAFASNTVLVRNASNDDAALSREAIEQVAAQGGRRESSPAAPPA